MVDRLIKRGNFDDKTEAIEKRCATFQVNKYRTRHNSKARFRGSPSYRMDDDGQNGKCISNGLHLSLRKLKHRFCKCENIC
jgi:hypothetical protein